MHARGNDFIATCSLACTCTVESSISCVVCMFLPNRTCTFSNLTSKPPSVKMLNVSSTQVRSSNFWSVAASSAFLLLQQQQQQQRRRLPPAQNRVPVPRPLHQPAGLPGYHAPAQEDRLLRADAAAAAAATAATATDQSEQRIVPGDVCEAAAAAATATAAAAAAAAAKLRPATVAVPPAGDRAQDASLGTAASAGQQQHRRQQLRQRQRQKWQHCLPGSAAPQSRRVELLKEARLF